MSKGPSKSEIRETIKDAEHDRKRDIEGGWTKAVSDVVFGPDSKRPGDDEPELQKIYDEHKKEK